MPATQEFRDRAFSHLLVIVKRCREHCEREPHNDWDDGAESGGCITYTCKVCGRQKTYPSNP